MNINDFKKCEGKDKNKFEIYYVNNGKSVKLVVKVHELLADFFFQTYIILKIPFCDTSYIHHEYLIIF